MTHVVIVERSKIVGRRIARHFLAVGAHTVLVEDINTIVPLLSNADVLCADAFDGDVVIETLRRHPGLRAILWTAEPLKKSLRYMAQSASIEHVLARKDFDSAPKDWELSMLAHRLVRSLPYPTLPHYLAYGGNVIDFEVCSTADRDRVVAHVQTYVATLQVPSRVVDMFAELCHELVMNALYDAPVDHNGHALFAADRKADIVLTPQQRPRVWVGCDGAKLAVQVQDRFGRLQRKQIVDGMLRGLSGGDMDRSHGGAGLGMMVCHNASSAMYFDVINDPASDAVATCVTGVFDLDVNLREFRMAAKSLHVVHHPSVQPSESICSRQPRANS
jgi:hypothetical protein